MNQLSDNSVDDRLRAELAGSDAVIGSLVPILRYLLTNGDNSLFSDEVVARVRGMLSDLSRQLVEAEEEKQISGSSLNERVECGAEKLLAHSALLAHLHSLALEWHLAASMQAQAGIDPVLSPLLQEQLAADDADKADAAMVALTAQARFIQHVRRMELPLAELPGDLFHSVILSLRSGGEEEEGPAEKALRAGYDESRTRLGLLARLVTAIDGGVSAALSLEHAGVAIFLSALSLATMQDRQRVVLATHERQLPKLALLLRAAGLEARQIREQAVILHPQLDLAEHLLDVSPSQAASLLADVASGDVE